MVAEQACAPAGWRSAQPTGSTSSRENSIDEPDFHLPRAPASHYQPLQAPPHPELRSPRPNLHSLAISDASTYCRQPCCAAGAKVSPRNQPYDVVNQSRNVVSPYSRQPFCTTGPSASPRNQPYDVVNQSRNDASPYCRLPCCAAGAMVSPRNQPYDVVNQSRNVASSYSRQPFHAAAPTASPGYQRYDLVNSQLSSSLQLAQLGSGTPHISGTEEEVDAGDWYNRESDPPQYRVDEARPVADFPQSGPPPLYSSSVVNLTGQPWQHTDSLTHVSCSEASLDSNNLYHYISATKQSIIPPVSVPLYVCPTSHEMAGRPYPQPAAAQPDGHRPSSHVPPPSKPFPPESFDFCLEDFVSSQAGRDALGLMRSCEQRSNVNETAVTGPSAAGQRKAACQAGQDDLSLVKSYEQRSSDVKHKNPATGPLATGQRKAAGQAGQDALSLIRSFEQRSEVVDDETAAAVQSEGQRKVASQTAPADKRRRQGGSQYAVKPRSVPDPMEIMF